MGCFSQCGNEQEVPYPNQDCISTPAEYGALFRPPIPFSFHRQFPTGLPFGIPHILRISLAPTQGKAQATNLQLIRAPIHIAIETSVEFEGEDFILLTRSHHPVSWNETIENYADNVPLCRSYCSVRCSSLLRILHLVSRMLEVDY